MVLMSQAERSGSLRWLKPSSTRSATGAPVDTPVRALVPACVGMAHPDSGGPGCHTSAFTGAAAALQREGGSSGVSQAVTGRRFTDDVRTHQPEQAVVRPGHMRTVTGR